MAWFFQQVVYLMIMTVKCCTACEECTLFVIVMTELFRWGCCGQEGNCDLRNCLDRVVVAGEAIMIGLLMSWRHSRGKLSVWYHDCEMSKSVQISVNCGVRVLRARGARASHALRACEPLLASLPSPALCFSASLQTFCFTARAYLDQRNSDCLAV